MKSYISYSEIALWKRDRDQYVKKYIRGEEIEPSIEQKVGRIIHETIKNPHYRWLKELRELGFKGKELVPIRKCVTKLMSKRPPESEVGYQATDRSGNRLFCMFDGLAKKRRELYEYKTSLLNEEWSQFIVDYHRQLSFYAYAYWLNTHHFFKNIHLYYADLRKGTVSHYETARGVRDVNWIRLWAEEAIEEIKKEGLWEKRLGRNDFLLKNNLKLV